MLAQCYNFGKLPKPLIQITKACCIFVLNNLKKTKPNQISSREKEKRVGQLKESLYDICIFNDTLQDQCRGAQVIDTTTTFPKNKYALKVLYGIRILGFGHENPMIKTRKTPLMQIVRA